VIVAALPYARDEDRAVLVGALGSSRGREGVPALYQLVKEQGPGSSRVRSSAVQQVATRVGKEATPVYAEALRDRSAEVQTAALLVLVECGDDRAVPDVLAYLKRRLRRKNRLATWDPREVPGTIAFALRHGVLDQVAQILIDNLTRLGDEEWTRLMAAWPQVASGRLSGSQGLRPPNPLLLDDWLYEYGGRREDRQDDDAGAWESAVIKALARAQERAQDQSTL
jgi:HEAT repeat protein